MIRWQQNRMARFEHRATPALYVAIIATLGGVAIADFLTPLGIAVFVSYLIPIALTLFVWRPAVPLIAALLATVLMLIGFFLSPAGVDLEIARINRAFGAFTAWVVAGVGYQFINAKITQRREEWLKSGLAQLNQKLAGDQSLQTLGENALRFLSDYLGAQAGAIFIESPEGFRRFATYAVPAESAVPESILPGQGLLGQAVKDRRPFVVNNVPEGYLAIGSSLGRTQPRHLLIAPAVVDDHANAVLELGFLHVVDAEAQELLTRTSESIAIAVRSADYRTRLQMLLEETQRQAEELQVQSEELRVSNEELEEQSRALEESQVRLEQQQTELEQTNSQLEEQTQLLEAQRDDLNRVKNTLEGQARELELASRYKSDFLAKMSHELRTPLNSSLILSKLLTENREGNLTSEQLKYAETIYSAGNDLLILINDVLDLSKVEAGRIELNPQLVMVSRLLDNLRSTFEPIAAEKALRLQFRATPGAPESFRTDSQRLEQILKNLLSNAIKFTAQGGVELEVAPAAGQRLTIAIRDTGIGIPLDQQLLIFEPFRQAEGTTSPSYGGTGLGLSISRELVRLLGGTISVSSQPGRGTTFTVTLPEEYTPQDLHDEPRAATPSVDLAPASATPPAPPAPPLRIPPVPRINDDRQHLTGAQRMILIVEDDNAFARILYDLAHELGFQGIIAQSSDEALALAAQHVPSAVVLDVGLPGNTGLSVLERLKSDARTRHIPVHVVSGSDYARTALALGAVGYILKPVKREQLVEAFQKLETRLTQKLRRVLIVEDDPVQLESLRQLLGSRDVQTVAAATATECLQQLSRSTFDCMVLDLSLPDASGFALLQTLSTEDRYAFPPVIVYTGRELEPEEEERLRRYSKSIIIKGAKSPERLLDEVTLFLHQVVAELPPEQQKLLQKARGRDEALEGRRILIVEDDVRNVFALTSILEPRGAILQVARNGREALDVLQRSLEKNVNPVDLVLMDVMMPEMDGLTAIREIRKRPEWSRLPIITLTAKAMKQDQQECLGAGANDYIAKPLDVEKLVSLIHVWMPR